MRWVHRTLCVLSFVGAAGCGEGVGPPPSVSRDLDFVLPAVKGTAGVVNRTVGVMGVGEVARQGEASIVADESNAMIAYIYSHYATASFSDDHFQVAYGMYSSGTGYTISPSFTINREDGSELMTYASPGISEDLPWPYFFHPTGVDDFRIATRCGAFANVRVGFEARSLIPIVSAQVMRVQKRVQTPAQQLPCAETAPAPAPTSGTGGGGTASKGAGFTVCYYEVWVDLYGRVVDVIALGCYRITTEAM